MLLPLSLMAVGPYGLITWSAQGQSPHCLIVRQNLLVNLTAAIVKMWVYRVLRLRLVNSSKLLNFLHSIIQRKQLLDKIAS